ARIPEAEIERLKNEVSVERLVEASGIELKRAGKDLLGRCPFHEDGTASLVVTPAKNLWHCFGCGLGGGPIDWVIKSRGVSFRHAVELLREGISSLAAEEGGVKRSRVRTLPAPVEFEADDQALLDQVVGYYHERLLQSPEALGYLEARGLAGAARDEAIRIFRLGVADRTLGLRLPAKTRKAGSQIRARLARIGLYRESGHEHFNGSLIVPTLDEAGHVVEIYGRKLRDDLRAGTPKHLYLPTREGRGRGVFNRQALAGGKEIILCEALIDALTFWCAGYRNVTSSYGIEGFTDEMLEAFRHYGTQRVLIAFDRDEAGSRGAAKVAERLMAANIECFRIQFPKDMDANEYALKVTPAVKSLGLLIRKAVWLGKGQAPAQPETRPVVDTSEAPALPPSVVDVPAPSSSTNPDPIPAPLPASPMPEAGPVPSVTVTDDEVTLTLGEGKDARRYRVRGLSKNLAVDVLKVNLMVARNESFHVDTLDLYGAKSRASYIVQAAQETGLDERLLKADLGRVLLVLEGLQDDAIHKVLQAEPQPQMAQDEQEAALAFLRAPNLVERLLADFAACGLVGEETNKLVGYLAAVSRLLERPLGVVIQSSSAAGKSSLMDAVLAFIPDEEKVKYSAMTGQSLFYMGETNLRHKALAIVEEEGASRAAYALKLLQSEGELTIASTGKDPQSGNLVTQAYRVEGPVALLFTTTARDVDEELMNRCLVLAVDEGREQTRAIHHLQRDRRTLEGLLAKREKEALIRLHQNAQRLLRPLEVLNPYARFLTFPDQTTRLRRDHEKYLTLIDAVAFLHQHQRGVKAHRRGEQVIEYIEATLDDIALANRIAHDVLGCSLDELPPQTRRLLGLIDRHVANEAGRLGLARAEVRFSRRALREAIAWGDTQLKIHLARLSELEYLVAHRGKHGGFEYELVYALQEVPPGGASEGGALRFPGLADIEALRRAYDAARSGADAGRSAPGRGVVGPRSGRGRPPVGGRSGRRTAPRRPSRGAYRRSGRAGWKISHP
ncbi:MAG: CHC2 zinc finger domain-containing protein, partial [Betaproteobacteria bacterium]|nr:CHC2 zinc finger domain-containing protein [Betaproteobacteria bacterium]